MSCSTRSLNGRGSGPVSGHLINKRGKLELVILMIASAGVFSSGTYPKFLASTVIFPSKSNAKRT